MNTETTFDMDALLDGTLDDLADMPEFKPFTPGIHKCKVTMKVKEIEKFPVIEVGLKVIETIEVSPGVEPMLPGAETSCAFFMKHSNPLVAEMGQGKVKILFTALASHFGQKSNRDLMADANGAEMLVVTGQRENKDKTKKFTDIVEWSVA